MVKKITGTTSSTNRPSQVDSGTAVTGAKVDSVDRVSRTEAQAGVARARKATRPMTAEEREMLFRLINEEADKLFAGKQIPESQRKSIEGAVKMAIDASIIEDDEQSE